MNWYDRTKHLSDADFKQIIGVKRETFAAMAAILTAAYQKKHRRGGRKPKRSLEEQLLLTLKYLRQYVTQKELAYEFGVGEATVHDTIVWVEDTLVKDGKFNLPGKKALLEDSGIEAVLIDVTECPVERPQKTAPVLFGKKEEAHDKDTGCREQEDGGNHMHSGRVRQDA